MRFIVRGLGGIMTDLKKFYDLKLLKPSVARFFSVYLVAIHLALMVFFWWEDITIMFYMNIFSVAFYCILLRMVKEQHILCVIGACIEVIAHMFLAILCTGFETGFTFYFLVVIQSLFYYNYQLIRLTGVKHNFPKIGILVIIVLTLAAGVFLLGNGPLYVLSRNMNYALLIINFLVGSTFSILYFMSYEHYALQTQKDLEFMAMSDELTGLYNRWHMMKMMEQCVLAGESYAIGILDVDDFKQVNDTYGHSAGDLILKKISEELESMMDDHTYICRWGGEEFLIMSTGCESEHEVADRMQELIHKIQETEYRYEEATIRVTLTAGVAARSNRSDCTMDHVIKAADDLLYRGKLAGKNRIVREGSFPDVEKIPLT